MSTTVRLSARVGRDRRLILDLPAEIPVGPVEVTIRSQVGSDIGPSSPANEARDAARAKLAAAGFLETSRVSAPGARELTEEERLRLGTLRAGARPSEELIAEDRGAY